MSDEPRGVQTNGKGWITTNHLNLTRSMADVLAKRSPAYPDYRNNRFKAKSRRNGA